MAIASLPCGMTHPWSQCVSSNAPGARKQVHLRRHRWNASSGAWTQVTDTTAGTPPPLTIRISFARHTSLQLGACHHRSLQHPPALSATRTPVSLQSHQHLPTVSSPWFHALHLCQQAVWRTLITPLQTPSSCSPARPLSELPARRLTYTTRRLPVPPSRARTDGGPSPPQQPLSCCSVADATPGHGVPAGPSSGDCFRSDSCALFCSPRTTAQHFSATRPSSTTTLVPCHSHSNHQ